MPKAQGSVPSIPSPNQPVLCTWTCRKREGGWEEHRGDHDQELSTFPFKIEDSRETSLKCWEKNRPSHELPFRNEHKTEILPPSGGNWTGAVMDSHYKPRWRRLVQVRVWDGRNAGPPVSRWVFLISLYVSVSWSCSNMERKYIQLEKGWESVKWK